MNLFSCLPVLSPEYYSATASTTTGTSIVIVAVLYFWTCRPTLQALNPFPHDTESDHYCVLTKLLSQYFADDEHTL